VQAHSTIQLTHPGAFDTTITFPNGSTSYRKIIMVFTMGKYVCPGSPTYCGQWDYTVQNYLMSPSGDTLELGRMITPYGGAGTGPFTYSWKLPYYFDVTDLYPKLVGGATIRLNYSGYSYGYTGDIKFAFIEGTPPRNVVDVKRQWHGYFNYGGATSVNNSFPQITNTVPANTQSTELKFSVTGHGSDNNGCCEFMGTAYDVLTNAAVTGHDTIWRANCGFNDIYPQSGTWVYDRANWCPGDIVDLKSYTLPVTVGSTFKDSISYLPYTSPGGSLGGYTIESHIIYYKGFNHTLDASLEDVIAPTNYEGHFRSNSLCGSPIVRIKNNGSDTVTSVAFWYGVDGYNTNYVWHGTLPPLQEYDVVLPEPWDLRVVSGDASNHNFMAQILQVNGQADQDTTNNLITTVFKPAPKWTVNLLVLLQTNAVAENSWAIYDANTNALMAQRVGSVPNTLYSDTIELGPACYKLVVTDAGCDGLSWWANSAAGNGYIRVKTKTTNPFIQPYPFDGYYNGDFGCGFTQYFTTSFPAGVTEMANNTSLEITTFPNPATNSVTISINGINQVDGVIRIYNTIGQIISEEPCHSASQVVNTSALPNGVYQLVFINNADKEAKLHTKLVIVK
jgi:hypothetical protein